MSDAPPRKRSTDFPFLNVRENWYRDVWLALITIALLLIAARALTVSHDARGAAAAANASAQAAEAAAQAARAATSAVQSQRAYFARVNCQGQAARHDATIKQLRKFTKFEQSAQPDALVGLFTLVGIHVTPSAAQALAEFEKRQLAGNFAQTAFLIDALQPKQNCADVVATVLGKRGASTSPAVGIPPIILPHKPR